MNLIDTHTHLYVKAFDGDRDAMIQRAIDAGVQRFYLPAIDSEHIAAMFALEQRFPQHCFAMMGLHPCSVDADYEKELTIIEDWLQKRQFCAIGEIGLDLYWDKTHYEQQRDAFIRQIKWAKQYEIPIVIHSRDATDECIEIVRAEKDDSLNGVFHCFGGSLEQADAIIDVGFYMGIGGVLTYPKSGLDAILASVDLAHIVLETDAPYLAPVPYRGKRNESAYITHVAERLAAVKGIDAETVAKITTENALNLFAKTPVTI